MEITRHCARSLRAIRQPRHLSSTREITLPSFLVPAFAPRPHASRFSTSSRCSSKIGAAPLTLPPEVTIRVIEPQFQSAGARVGRKQEPSTVEIEGPLGKLSMTVPPFIKFAADEEKRTRSVSVLDSSVREQREMWGTVRAYLNNHILGVSEGHTAILRIVGVGYRATVEKTATTIKPEFPGQEYLSLKLGYSHPIELGIPKGIKASTPQPTRILLESIEKEVVNKFAAQIRDWRRPEPYKGKGIYVNGETIRLKAKKIK